MEIQLDVVIDDGCFAGPAQRVCFDDALSFSGTLEASARVERALPARFSPTETGLGGRARSSYNR
jgi:hypothetical protein